MTTSTAIAGPSNETVPPPSHIQQGELTEAELARLRLPTKQSFFKIGLSKSKSRSLGRVSSDASPQMERMATPQREASHPRSSTESEDTPFIKIGNNTMYADEFMENYDKDVYRWAVVYENQRG